MQEIEPYFAWRDLYTASEDSKSPFYEREYSEFECSNTIYNYYIHPQWDDFGSPSLYLKVLFADYENGYAILEFLGEWNDAIHNDIMFLKREIAENMIRYGIQKFILIGENVLNFHASDDCYYEDWFQDIENGWIALVNFRPHVIDELGKVNLDFYLNWGGELDDLSWRNYRPDQLFMKVSEIVEHRLGA